MEYRTLGRTGLKLSSLVLGTANFADPTPEDEATEIVERAVDAGINLIDTGDNYAAGECERYLGIAVSSAREIILGRIVMAHIRTDIIDPATFYSDHERLDARRYGKGRISHIDDSYHIGESGRVQDGKKGPCLSVFAVHFHHLRNGITVRTQFDTSLTGASVRFQ